MTDWVTISSLATAGGTLILAVATFSSVRASSRSARIAERALQINLRPILFPSRSNDLVQSVRWSDGYRVSLLGGGASPTVDDGKVYLALSVRNVGTGIAVLRGWHVAYEYSAAGLAAPDITTFRRQERDLYVPAGDMSFWHAAIRSSDDPDHNPAVEAIESRTVFAVELLHADHEGGQWTVSRFAMIPIDAPDDGWEASVVRHWHVDPPTDGQFDR